MTAIHHTTLARTAGALLAAALLGALPTVAAAAQPANYGAIHLGRNDLTGWPARVDFGFGVGAGGRLALDPKGHGGIMFGRQTENARFEVEYQQGRAHVSGASLGPVSQAVDAAARYELLTLNAYRTYAFSERVSVFGGAGFGRGTVSLPRLPPVSGCNCFAAAKHRGFVYQLRVGAEYSLTAADHMFAQYSALRLPGASSGGAPSVSYPQRKIGAFEVGYRRTF